STVARGAVAAGARGLIRGGEREDLVVSVAKGLMLMLRGSRRAEATRPRPEEPSSRGPNEEPGSLPRPNDEGPAVPLPLQRHEEEEAEAEGADTPNGAGYGRGENAPNFGADAEEAVQLEVALG